MPAKLLLGPPSFGTMRRLLAKKYAPKSKRSKEKEDNLSGLSTKKIQKVLLKIEEMVDVFLNLANFAKHTFSTLAPPSG